jgi:hypothetical protein
VAEVAVKRGATKGANKGKTRQAVMGTLRKQRCQTVLELRIKAVPFREIGEQLGISHVQAWHDYKYAMGELLDRTVEKAEALRKLEVGRLDWMLERLKPKLEEGDEKAVDTALRISKRRASLYGLDAPVKQEVSGSVERRVVIEWAEPAKVIEAQVVETKQVEDKR